MAAKQNLSMSPNTSALETRDSQLWWLAVLIIVLLACALSAVDWSSALQAGPGHPLSVALNTRFMRIALVLSVLAISAYFKDTARRLRRINHRLINDLQDRSAQLERKNVEVSKLKDLSDELIGLVDLPKALELALNMAVEVIGVDVVSIMLREKGTDLMRIAASRGLPEEVVEATTVRVGDAISGRVAESGEAIILNSDDPESELFERARRLNELISAIIVPIRVDSEARGVINVSKRRGGDRFTADDLRVLTTLANQLALVLRKIELWEDLQKQVAMLEQAFTELKQAQADLVQSEKLASIGQFAGGISHEINNPLQVIMGRIEMLQQGFPDESIEAKHLSTVLEHVQRIATIVSSLLRFARRQPEQEEDAVSVDDTVNDAVRLLGKQLNLDDIELTLALACPDTVVVGSRVKVQQVFMNLIMNAYQAMKPTGGKLAISSCQAGNEVVVTVVDTGPGIPPEHLPHIFEPFFTTKPEGEGTGLGLSVTYGIVESHGGRLAVESEVGIGTTFTVSFPQADAIREAA